MNDQFRYENLTQDELNALRQEMLTFQSPSGETLNPNWVERTLFGPDAAESFNKRPTEVRQKVFEKIASTPVNFDAIIDERLKSATKESSPVNIGQIFDQRISDIQQQRQSAITKEQQTLAAAVPQIDASGRVIRDQPAPAKPAPRSFIDYLKNVELPRAVGAAETVATLGSQAAVAPVAAGAQVLKNAARIAFSDKGIEKGDPLYREIMEGYTYQPRTEEAQGALQEISKAFEASKLPPVATGAAPTVLPTAKKSAVKPKMSVKEYEQTVAAIKGVPYQTEQQIAATTSKSGASIGAAGLDVEQQRVQRGRELPFPIEYEKSQITRNPADVRFARETAKDPVLGQPFQERYAQQNELLQRNLDFFAEQTGSEKLGLPQADFAKSLTELVDKNKRSRKNEVSQAYDAARNAGETAELVDIKPLQNWVKENRSSAKNAPVIQTVESEIKRLSKDGKISLNDIEEIRKTINDVYDVSPTNARFGGRAIKVIDNVTEGKGGDLYKKARSLSSAYKTEFQDTPAVAKITAMKRGTTQRQVALEDLVDNVMMRGTGEDVRQLFGSLQNMGPEGQAMINDLKGYVAEKIKNEATKGVQRDINGKPYIETKTLNNIITNLDKSQKLEFLFGKKVAEQYRTINEAVKDIQTVPKDTTNPSGTAATLLAGMAEMGGQYAMTGLPVPLLTIAKKGIDYKRQQTQMKKIKEFLEYGQKKD